MERRHWYPTETPTIGSVAIWECREDIVLEDSILGHSGIYVGDGDFVSHSSYERTPIVHAHQLRDGRLPIAFYAHDMLTDTPQRVPLLSASPR